MTALELQSPRAAAAAGWTARMLVVNLENILWIVREILEKENRKDQCTLP